MNRKTIMRKPLLILLILAGVPGIVLGAGLHTVDYNYINDLIGDRAMGMGGAFTAISDDPSGAWYNPAGLVFAFDSQISLSVNSFQRKTLTIADAIEFDGRLLPYEQQMSTFYPSFFGVVQSLGDVKFAFTVTTINNEFLDQDTFYSSPDGSIFNMKYNLSDSTVHFGLSAAVFISDSMAVGATFSILRRRTEQINSYMRTAPVVSSNQRYLLGNQYITDDAWGGTARVGIQWMPEKTLSFGMSMLVGTMFSHDRDVQLFNQNPDQTGNFLTDANFSYGDGVSIPSALPVNLRIGAAWFPSKDFLVSADLIGDFGSEFFQNTRLKSTLNGALGVEYYLAPVFPVRFGLFTNLANTPKIIPGQAGQPMHANLLGFSMGISWQTRNSSISLSMSYQGGSGQMQVSADDPTAIQEVSISKLAVALTGSAKY